ncbi:hypothetical protein GGX14DRAFT_370302, partial [Mycena pura]
LLTIVAEVSEFVSVPGLKVAASLLLNIWDNVQGVDIDVLACLRLAERCAGLLNFIVQEVHAMGNDVEEEMKEPLHKLIETFTQVRDLLVKQARRPFLKRYLKREENLREIAGCDTAITDALSQFSVRSPCTSSV